MPNIALASAKGGCGKTTLAINLAVDLALDGARAAILDADPNQHSAEFFFTFRKKTPTLPDGAAFTVFPKVDEKNLFATLKEAHKIADFVFLDLPGVASKLNLMGMTRAHLVLIPVQPSKMDARDGLRTAETVPEAAETADREIPFRFVFTRWPVVTETIVARHTKAQLTKKQMPVLRTPFMDRTQFKEMTFSGLTPRVSDPSGNAAENIRSLNAEILAVLDQLVGAAPRAAAVGA